MRRVLALLLVLLAVATASAAEPLQFNRDVRPILAENCFACHGPDSASRKADLRLDQRDAAIDVGALSPGEPDDSEMIRRIFSDDPADVMPPASGHQRLTIEQKETLRRWIVEGAKYQPHWSFIAPVRNELPSVKNEAWVRNPIDRFILARLETEGLQPAPEADRRTLARRVSLDLTGLPPEPALVEEFINDAAPDAYEKLVGKLLAMPQWGEHRGRYWLDYARYGDTHGIHFDNYREMWSYREWVIRAFASNMPYDQFTMANLAGDLLPDRTLDQQIGSGFNRCNITTNEGGIIDEEYLVLYTRDRTETTSTVWLGLTAACAVCHDHKFDPLSQREFYEMAAFFNNTTQGARDGNVKDTPPIVTVPMKEDRQRWTALKDEIPLAEAQLAKRKEDARPSFDEWLASVSPDEFGPASPSEGLYLYSAFDEGQGQELTLQLDGSERTVALATSARWQPGRSAGHALQLQGAATELPEIGDFDKDQAFSTSAWVKLPANDASGAIVARMDDKNDYRGWDMWYEGRKVGMHLIHKWSDDALKVVAAAQVPGNEWTHVLVTYDGSGKAAGIKIYYNGKLQDNQVQADQLKSTIRTEVPLKLGQRHSSSPASGVVVDDLRVYRRTLSQQEAQQLAGSLDLAAMVRKPADQRSEQEIERLMEWWLLNRDPESIALRQALAKLQREQNDLQSRATIAHVMQERNAEPIAFVLNRGDYDKRGDQVSADTPDILPPFPEEAPRNRLGFAQWLLLPEHPLTSRVTVNRFWQEVFGQGLVGTPGDFGITGELPSHPELLDWLAVEFRESGWDVKQLFKLMVTSAAYRQSAVTTPEKLEVDRSNRLLSRGPRFRMDAEMIRDYALASSGLLVHKIGGPSVRPYQPPGIWDVVGLPGGNTRNYIQDTGDSLYRRSLYTFWKRMAPPASLETLNAPNREVCTVRRERTNTPLQAMVTLNDEQFVEAARHLAQRALKEGGSSVEERFAFLSHRLLARSFRAEEVEIVRQSLEQLQAYYQSHPDYANELLAIGQSPRDSSLATEEVAAWTMLTNELMNLDEVLTK